MDQRAEELIDLRLQDFVEALARLIAADYLRTLKLRTPQSEDALK